METIILSNNKSDFIQKELNKFLFVQVVKGTATITLLDIFGGTKTFPIYDHDGVVEVQIRDYVKFFFQAKEETIIKYELKML